MLPRFLQWKAKEDPVSLYDPRSSAPQVPACSVLYLTLLSLLKRMLSSPAEFVSRKTGGAQYVFELVSLQCLYLAFWLPELPP